ncbi:MAG: DNA polymerase Y family protein [Planctomycetota bacterium]
MACIDLPALPLQLLLRREPEWRGHPCAVVDSDKPQGRICFVNSRAQKVGILPGFRYAAGLAIDRDLRAGIIDDEEVAACRAEVVSILQRFTPSVEPSDVEPGVFWLDLRGLHRLYPEWQIWAEQVPAALAEARLRGRIAVGFRRFGTYAAARVQKPKVHVFGDEEAEEEFALGAPLTLLAITPKVRDVLLKLGLQTVGDLQKLPESGLRRRFGADLWNFYQFVTDQGTTPVAGEVLREPLVAQILFDDGIDRSDQLLLAIEDLLMPLLDMMSERDEAMVLLLIEFSFDHFEPLREEIRPAEPTLDMSQLLGLILLRLEHIKLPEGVIEISVELEGVRVTGVQQELFVDRPARDLEAANRALARMRARFGNDSVCFATLKDGHLPEAQTHWGSCQQIARPQPDEVRYPPLVRRYYRSPIPLAPRGRHEPDGWLLSGLEAGSVERLIGPYVIAGGWWARCIEREYYFAQTRKGSIYWVYYDRLRRRWFLHGAVS